VFILNAVKTIIANTYCLSSSDTNMLNLIGDLDRPSLGSVKIKGNLRNEAKTISAVE
jgi:hypothetical protein